MFRQGRDPDRAVRLYREALSLWRADRAYADVTDHLVAAEVARVPGGDTGMDVVVEHPTGFFTVTLDVDRSGPVPDVTRSALLRTARMLMRSRRWW